MSSPENTAKSSFQIIHSQVPFVDLQGIESWSTICDPSHVQHMAVSEKRGTPKSSHFNEFSIINHPFWGTICGNTHVYLAFCETLKKCWMPTKKTLPKLNSSPREKLQYLPNRKVYNLPITTFQGLCFKRRGCKKRYQK